MKRLLCPQIPKPRRPTVLSEEEANHALRVLRLRDGDTVEAIDGQGHSAPAILRIHGGAARLELAAGGGSSAGQATPGATLPLRLELAVLKSDAMEWVVEKAVELGVRSLTPLLTAHTVVQVKGKGPEAFRERWQKIADQSLKQCGRLERLHIDAPLGLEELMARETGASRSARFWCDEAAGNAAPSLAHALGGAPRTAQGELRLLVGPEGGWSEAERERLQSFGTRVTLGPLVLRAETATLFAVSLVTSALREQRADASNLLTKKDG